MSQIELGFGTVAGFLRRGENRSTRRKTSQSKGENPQQTQPTCGDVVISSEDVCWNIRNVKLKFFSFQKCVYISLSLSPQFDSCFFSSWDGQKTRVSTIDNYWLLTIQGPLWLSLNRVEIKYRFFAVFFLLFSRGEPVPWRNCTTVPHSCSLTSVRSTTTFFVGTEITLNLSNGQNWLRISVRRTVLILIKY